MPLKFFNNRVNKGGQVISFPHLFTVQQINYTMKKTVLVKVITFYIVKPVV